MNLERTQADEITHINTEGQIGANIGVMQANNSGTRVFDNTEEKLRQSEERFQALIKATAQIAWTTTAYGLVEEDIPLWRSYTGQSEAEVKGWGWLDAVHPDDRERTVSIWSDAIGARSLYETEYALKRYDGIYHSFLVRGVPVFNEDGSIREWIGFCTDITEFKRVEEERTRLLASEQAARATAEAATKRLQALQDITDTALAHLTLNKLLHEMLVRVREVMDVDNSAILLVTEDGQYLTVYTAIGPEEQVAPQVRVPVGQGFAGKIAAHREPLIVADPSKAEIITPLLREKLRSLLGVPLLVEDRVIGVIHVGTLNPRQFTEEDVRLLQRAADRIALAVDHAHLYESEQHSRIDAIARAKQLEAIFEAIVDGVIVYDSEGRIQQMNSTAREILAVNSQPDYSTSVLDDRFSLLRERLFPFKVLDDHGIPLSQEQWPVIRILNGEMLKGSNAVDIRSSALDGREIELSITGSPVFGKGGDIVGAVTIMRDVTERRRLERSTHEALKALLAMAEVLVLVPDNAAEVHTQSLLKEKKTIAESTVARRLAELTRDILNCQRVGITTIESETTVLRAMAIVGLSPEQEVQWWAEQQQHESRLSDSRTPELISRLRANEVLQLDMTQPPFSDQPNPYGIQTLLVAPMCIGDQLVGILSLDNGSIRHEYTQDEMALAGAVAKLAGLVIERERLLQEREESRANEIALRAANRRMDEFLGIACHELKTPLAAIKGNVQLAERRLQRLTSDRKTQIDRLLPDLLENANRQTDRLDRLVSDLLDVSRIQVGKLEMRSGLCDLETVVQETIQEQRMINPTRSILVEMLAEEAVPIEADADRIGQVVANYLTNALKYSSVDKPVTVFLEMEGPVARVSVQDEGPGLPPAEQERIWERFHRVRGVEVQAGSGIGLGLGLYISKTIITWHGGRVGVASTPGQGSTFWFTLPLAQQQSSS
ncbi:MAG: GAF domain-containing protein [Ktedonobacteraceae bacterium]